MRDLASYVRFKRAKAKYDPTEEFLANHAISQHER
jgi:hypothetical protein